MVRSFSRLEGARIMKRHSASEWTVGEFDHRAAGSGRFDAAAAGGGRHAVRRNTPMVSTNIGIIRGASPTATTSPARARDFALGEAETEKGMAEMSEKFREIGSELYVGADGRAHG
jgi:hypothetical protein